MGWEWIVARGQKVFQCGYQAVSRTIEKIKEAGARMRAEPAIESMAEPRGTIMVESPAGDGHGEELREPSI